MVTIKRLLCFLAFFILLAGQACAEEFGFRPRLGCIPFLSMSLQAMAFTEDISSSLLNSIDRNRYFEIVERKKIEQFLELEGYRLDNLDSDSIVKVSSKAGLDYVVHGSVNVTDAGTTLDLALMNVRSRKVLLKDTYNLSQSDFSRRLLDVAGVIVERVKAGVKQAQAPTLEAAVVQLAAPHGLEASGTANSIRLRWGYNQKQVAGYNVYRSATAGGQYSLHATTTEPVFNDENMKLNEVFYYRVAAVGPTGAISELTTPVRGGTAIAPPPPIFMNVEPDIKGATLVWRARPGLGGDPRTEAQGYRVYRKQGDESPVLVAKLPVDALTYADSGLNEGTKYIYTITASNGEGAESEFSSRLSVMPLPVPKQVRLIAGRIRHVPVTWDRYPAEQAEGYVLYRSDSKDGRFVPIARFDGPTATTHTDRDLGDKTTYWYRVAAYKKGGVETAQSEPVSAQTREIPPAPVNITAAGGQPRMVTLRWKLAGVPDDEIKSVLIYRMLEENGTSMEKVGEVAASQETFVDDRPPLQDRTTYFYRLTARNSGGAVSAQSAIVSATTKAPPATPAKLAATGGGVKKVDLTWDPNPESDIREYQIFVKRPEDPEFKLVREQRETRFQDISLRDGAEYGYKIRAIDRDGLISPFSAVVSAVTKPLPARVAGFAAADAASRSVTWKPSAEKDVHRYNIYKKGFLGAQKVATVRETRWQSDEPRGQVEYYVTAEDDGGLESEPSDTVIFK